MCSRLFALLCFFSPAGNNKELLINIGKKWVFVFKINQRICVQHMHALVSNIKLENTDLLQQKQPHRQKQRPRSEQQRLGAERPWSRDTGRPGGHREQEEASYRAESSLHGMDGSQQTAQRHRGKPLLLLRSGPMRCWERRGTISPSPPSHSGQDVMKGAQKYTDHP